MRCPACHTMNQPGTAFCVECGTRLASAVPEPAPVGPATGAIPQQTVLQNRYVIAQKLGQGGMGAVYRARDMRLSTVNWAVKEMSQGAITGPLELQQAREAFLREAEMLAGLSHPHLPRVTDHFEQDGKAYLVMEFVPGETLLAFLQREGLPQPLGRVLEWTRQLCDVLEYLHAQHPPIIFRDLKPANIMLTPQAQLKLIDFGIARLFKPGQQRDTQAFGTMGYSAPEQYGRGQTDARSDIYTLGVLLHQLLTGYDPTSTPFRLPPAAQLNPTVPQHVSAALAAATDSDPNRRFPDVRAFRGALLGEADQVLLRQPSEPFNAQGALYSRPDSQPYSQPGSQPLGSGAPGKSTLLANLSRWIGLGSVAVMGLALVIVLVAVGLGQSDGGLAGAGYLLGFPPLAGGPIAIVLGLVALLQPQTSATTNGRRHAILGTALGVSTLLMCCAMFVLVGAANS